MADPYHLDPVFRFNQRAAVRRLTDEQLLFDEQRQRSFLGLPNTTLREKEITINYLNDLRVELKARGLVARAAPFAGGQVDTSDLPTIMKIQITHAANEIAVGVTAAGLREIALAKFEAFLQRESGDTLLRLQRDGIPGFFTADLDAKRAKQRLDYEIFFREAHGTIVRLGGVLTTPSGIISSAAAGVSSGVIGEFPLPTPAPATAPGQQRPMPLASTVDSGVVVGIVGVGLGVVGGLNPPINPQQQGEPPNPHAGARLKPKPPGADATLKPPIPQGAFADELFRRNPPDP